MAPAEKNVASHNGWLRAAAVAAAVAVCAVCLGCTSLAGTPGAGPAETRPVATAGSTPDLATAATASTKDGPAAAASTQTGHASAAAPAEASSAGRVSASGERIYVGVFKSPAPFDMRPLTQYTRLVGKRPAIVMWYQPWIDTSYGEFKTAEVRAVLEAGAIPMITWEPWDPGGDPHYLSRPAEQPRYRLSRIVRGGYDGYIRSWAKAAAAVDGTVMIRPMHEMNGNWYPWSGTENGNSPADFRAAWRRIHDIFAEEGASNVLWVWSINWNSFPNTSANRYAVYYPGDDYVDWTSISGFNWGTSKGYPHGRSFDQLYSKPLAYLRTLDKPVVLSEIACDTKGVDKPAWIRNTYRSILAGHPEIRGVIYYDRKEVGLKGTQDWQLTSSKASAAAYRKAISVSGFVGGSAASLLSSQSRMP